MSSSKNIRKFGFKMYFIGLYCLFYQKQSYVEELVDFDNETHSVVTGVVNFPYLSYNKNSRMLKLEIYNLRKIYCKSFLIFSVSLIFTFLIYFLGTFFSSKDSIFNFISLLQIIPITKIVGIVSVWLFSFATVARLGWKNWTWGGDTAVEILDYYNFIILYILASMFGFIAFIL